MLKFLILSIFILSFIQVGNSFAQFPTESLEITIKNVTINTPPQESSDEESSNPWEPGLIETILGFIAAVGAAFATFAFKWLGERNTPSTPEQERLFNEIVEEAYYRGYLPYWEQLWKKITKAPSKEESDKIIDDAWEQYLGHKLFPKDPKDREKIKEKAREYAKLKAKKAHLKNFLGGKNFLKNLIGGKNDEFINDKMDNIFNKADVKYYGEVSEKLPGLVKTAVLSTENLSIDWTDKKKSRDLTDPAKPIELKKWENAALKNLKRLMIFAFCREDIEVMKIMIKTEIKKIVVVRSKKEPKQEGQNDLTPEEKKDSS